jgi:hypothetical protein
MLLLIFALLYFFFFFSCSDFFFLSSCPYGSVVGGLVRLAFHDSVGGGGPNGLGGPNGCLDNITEHNGLARITSQYDLIFSRNPDFVSKISRADMWVLGAQLALQFSTASNGALQPQMSPATPLTFPFRFGRVDDASCLGADLGLLPAAGIAWAEMLALFSTRVGMTPAQGWD